MDTDGYAWPCDVMPDLTRAVRGGLELIIEAARQVRGTSTCQVKDAEISMVVSGPMVAPVSDLILRG